MLISVSYALRASTNSRQGAVRRDFEDRAELPGSRAAANVARRRGGRASKYCRVESLAWLFGCQHHQQCAARPRGASLYIVHTSTATNVSRHQEEHRTKRKRQRRGDKNSNEWIVRMGPRTVNVRTSFRVREAIAKRKICDRVSALSQVGWNGDCPSHKTGGAFCRRGLHHLQDSLRRVHKQRVHQRLDKPVDQVSFDRLSPLLHGRHTDRRKFADLFRLVLALQRTLVFLPLAVQHGSDVISQRVSRVDRFDCASRPQPVISLLFGKVGTQPDNHKTHLADELAGPPCQPLCGASCAGPAGCYLSARSGRSCGCRRSCVPPRFGRPFGPTETLGSAQSCHCRSEEGSTGLAARRRARPSSPRPSSLPGRTAGPARSTAWTAPRSGPAR